MQTTGSSRPRSSCAPCAPPAGRASDLAPPSAGALVPPRCRPAPPAAPAPGSVPTGPGCASRHSATLAHSTLRLQTWNYCSGSTLHYRYIDSHLLYNVCIVCYSILLSQIHHTKHRKDVDHEQTYLWFFGVARSVKLNGCNYMYR